MRTIFTREEMEEFGQIKRKQAIEEVKKIIDEVKIGDIIDRTLFSKDKLIDLAIFLELYKKELKQKLEKI